jgi:hypothetical protein
VKRGRQAPLRRLAGAVVSLALLLGGLPARASHDVMNPERCPLTHLVLETCPNLVKATFQDEENHHWSFVVAGPIAMFKKLETYSRQPRAVLILDYTSRNDKVQRMLVAGDAWFLYDADGDTEVCQAPFIYAFKDKDSALKAQHDVHGELLRWDSVGARAKKVAADWSPTGRHNIELQGRPD